MSMNRKIGTISKKFFRPYEWIYKFWASWIITKSIYGQDTITLTNAIMNKLIELRAFWWTKQNWTPTPTSPIDILCNNWTIKFRDRELPVWYKRITSITFAGSTYYDTNEKLYGSDTISMKLDQSWSGWRNIFGAYTWTSAWSINYSFYWYNTATWQAYLRYWETLYRPTIWTWIRTLTYWPWTTTGFATNVNITEDDFETSDIAYIGALPNSSSPKYEWDFIWNIEVSNSNGIRLKWIPCIREIDGVIWYYEVVKWNFLTPVWNTPTAWADDYSYSTEMYIDWTSPNAIEKIEDELWNLATCENLFWLWDIKDEQEILSWSIIRKIWIKVLDWTENWITWNGGVRYNFQWDVWSFETTSMLCSHYNYAGANVSITDMSSNQFSANSNWNISFKSAETTSASDFKTRLSDQVSAWTPVFVIYQKQNPTTDTVARQTLDIQTWTNVIEITQASISPLDLFAKYKATE